MPIDPSRFLTGEKDQYAFDQQRRSDRAKAFQEYKNMKIENGETIDPLELDRIRISLSGGDPYLSSMLPSQVAIDEIAKRANEKSALVRAGVQVESMKKMREKDSIVQSLIDENYDKSPDQLRTVFESSFGSDAAPDIYDQYSSQLPSMLNSAINKKVESIIDSDTMKYVKNEGDLYRFMPTEMKDQRIATILKNYVSNTVSNKVATDTATIMDVWSKMPDSIKRSPQGIELWKTISAQASGYTSVDSIPQDQRSALESLSNVTIKSSDNAKTAAIMDIASKSSVFLDAVRTGDEESIFTIVSQMMVASGYDEPTSKDDPDYVKVRAALNAVAQVSFIADYKQKKAKAISDSIGEVDAIEKSGDERMSWAAQSAFSDMGKYGVSENGKVSIDPRIKQAIQSIRTNYSFFPSDVNVKQAVDFIKKEYDNDPKSFDPAAAAEEFMSTAKLQSKNNWVETRSTNTVESMYGIEPGTNFKAWISGKSMDIGNEIDAGTSEIELLSPSERQEYIASLKKYVSNMRSTIDRSYNDPEIRMSIGDFNPAVADAYIQVIDKKIQGIEELHKQLSAKETPVYIGLPDNNTEQTSGRTGSMFVNNLANNSKAIMNSAIDSEQYRRSIMSSGTFPAAALMNNAIDYAVGRRPHSVGISPNKLIGHGTVTGSQTVDEVSSPFLDAKKEVGPGQADNTEESSDNFFNLMHAVSMIESGGKSNAQSSTSSARGLFQFTKGTWNALVSKYGEQVGVDSSMIMDPSAQKIMFALYARDNANYLMNRTGKKPSGEEIYMAHFLGPSGAAQLINNLGTGKLAAQMFPSAAKSNYNIFYKEGTPVTVDELYNSIRKKVKKYME